MAKIRNPRAVAVNADHVWSLFEHALKRSSIAVDDSIPKDVSIVGFTWKDGHFKQATINLMSDNWPEAEELTLKAYSERGFQLTHELQIVPVHEEDFYFDAADGKTWLEPDQMTFRIQIKPVEKPE